MIQPPWPNFIHNPLKGSRKLTIPKRSPAELPGIGYFTPVTYNIYFRPFKKGPKISNPHELTNRLSFWAHLASYGLPDPSIWNSFWTPGNGGFRPPKKRLGMDGMAWHGMALCGFGTKTRWDKNKAESFRRCFLFFLGEGGEGGRSPNVLFCF